MIEIETSEKKSKLENGKSLHLNILLFFIFSLFFLNWILVRNMIRPKAATCMARTPEPEKRRKTKPETSKAQTTFAFATSALTTAHWLFTHKNAPTTSQADQVFRCDQAQETSKNKRRDNLWAWNCHCFRFTQLQTR